MNEDEFARNEQRDRETASALADLGIQPADASLYHVIHYGITVPPSDLCRWAAIPYYSIGGPTTPKDNEIALANCLCKGLLQIVTETVLSDLQAEVQRQGLLGPIYGYPHLGGVEFTETGAEQWFRIRDRLYGDSDKSFSYVNVVHKKSRRYFPGKSVALLAIDKLKQYKESAVVGGPHAIGPWRANWWRRFNEGYRIDIERRGRCGSACIGGHVFLGTISGSLDVEHADNVLKRHQITWPEWLVMTALEHDHDLRRIKSYLQRIRPTYSGRLDHGGFERCLWRHQVCANLSEGELLGGLDSCLQKGWLRRIDGQVADEIRDLLERDRVFMPVPYDPHSFEFDFTIAGAEIYRNVSTDILGENWEDSILVEETCYLEEYRYCAVEPDIAALQEGDLESGQTPKSVRMVPIGPWCVRWWKRYSSGYRTELTFSKP